MGEGSEGRGERSLLVAVPGALGRFHPMSVDQSDPADRFPNRAIVRRYRLGAEPGDDLSATTTPEQRLALVWDLSRRLWALTGRPSASTPRDQIPVRFIRPA